MIPPLRSGPGKFPHGTPAVVIIGSGLAGMAAALALAPQPVLVLTKTAGPAGGSSLLAQGGIAAALGAGDSPSAHAADTIAAGAGMVDPGVALLLAREGAKAVRQLLADGLPFDRFADGSPLLGQEAAHRCPRIVHAGGDATGRTLMTALYERVAATPSIHLASEAFAAELVVEEGRVRGVVAFHRDHGWLLHPASAVILASGGVGQAWRYTTNPVEATGDGLALAARAGAALADLEFVQFHPTALAPTLHLLPTLSGAPLPLLTEALRGAGATVVDGQGRRFLFDEHPDGELAPRDVVARAVWRRRAAGEAVFLDARAVMRDSPERFPTLAATAAEAGIDPVQDLLPIVPAAHYHMGGVVTDTIGRTSLPGLWACGEVACTGVHGANRLASNSLLEALVFGRRIAAKLKQIMGRGRARTGENSRQPASLAPPTTTTPPHLLGESPDIVGSITRLMYEKTGLERDRDGLEVALDSLDRLSAPLTFTGDYDEVRRQGETANLLLIARMITAAALLREESRGAHCRRDAPATVPALAQRASTTSDVLLPVAATVHPFHSPQGRSVRPPIRSLPTPRHDSAALAEAAPCFTP